MFSKKLMDFSKELLNLNKLNILNQGESLLFDCNYIIQNFNLDDLKRIIKMFLFCVGIKKYNFEKVVYLKVDLNIIDVEMVKYIANIIRFTGRKDQIRLMLKINPKISHYSLEELKQIPMVTFYTNFKEVVEEKNIFVDFILFEEEDLKYQNNLKDFVLPVNMNLIVNLNNKTWVDNKKFLRHMLTKDNSIKISQSLSELVEFSVVLPIKDFRKEILKLYNYSV